MFPETIERTCAFCDAVFVQDASETLLCVCADCREGRREKAVAPETIDEHIKEEMEKSPEFKEAFDEEKKRLESEVRKTDGADNSDNGKPGKGV